MTDEDVDTVGIDWNHTLLLLRVIAEASAHSQIFSPIIACANAELAEIKAQAQAEMDERAAAAKEAAQPKVIPADEEEEEPADA